MHALLRLGGAARWGRRRRRRRRGAPTHPAHPALPPACRPCGPPPPLPRARARAGGAAPSYECYAASPERPCSPYADCGEWDDAACGFEHSTYQQAAFCAIREPPTWPALLQVPLAQYRNAQLQDDGALREGACGDGSAGAALAPAPPLLLPYTGRDQQAAGRLMGQLLARDANLSTQLLATFLRSPGAAQLAGGGPAGLAALDLCAPNTTRASLQQLLAAAAGNATSAAPAAGGGSSFGAADLGRASQQLSGLLSELGAVLGTAAPTSPTSYLEPAFIQGSAALDTQSGAGAGGGLAGGGLLGGGGSQARAAREAAGKEVRRRAAAAQHARAAGPSHLPGWRSRAGFVATEPGSHLRAHAGAAAVLRGARLLGAGRRRRARGGPAGLRGGQAAGRAAALRQHPAAVGARPAGPQRTDLLRLAGRGLRGGAGRPGRGGQGGAAAGVPGGPPHIQTALLQLAAAGLHAMAQRMHACMHAVRAQQVAGRATSAAATSSACRWTPPSGNGPACCSTGAAPATRRWMW